MTGSVDRKSTKSTLNLAHVVRQAQESTEGQAPGLLMLHGRGADELDLLGLEEALDPRLTIVSARAPLRLGPGFAWYGMYQMGQPDSETMRTSLDELREFVEGLVPAYNIDPQRLYLMGFSQGAIISSAIALLMPDRVRGVVMHSGYVPTNAGFDFQLARLEGKPFFVAHGLYDDVIPVAYGRTAREYLSNANADLTYREYPIGHSISEESLYDLSEWLTREIDDPA